jgi:hypothetical protein
MRNKFRVVDYMPAADFLVMTVVMGLLALGAAVGISRLRRNETTPRPSGSGAGARPAGAATTSVRTDAAVLGALAVLALAFGATAVVDTLTLVVLGLVGLIGGYFAWGVYSLARVRGLPRAHAVGLSAWLLGVVLIGGIAVQLLVG